LPLTALRAPEGIVPAVLITAVLFWRTMNDAQPLAAGDAIEPLLIPRPLTLALAPVLVV
jgi:hypothetical protein